MTDDADTQNAAPRPRLVLVTGPSGAGRSTAINVLEDLGFEVIDNLPMRLLPRLLEGAPLDHPMALGLDVRNRDFSAHGLVDLINALSARDDVAAELLYLDCRPEVLMRRYSETRRRHPLAADDHPEAGIARELDLLNAVRERADILMDTSDLTPHELRDAVQEQFEDANAQRLAISVQSFSYKRGAPRGLDLVMDCRFLRNPYWQPELRKLTGLSDEVAQHVAGDPRFDEFFEKILGLTEFLLPAYTDEGKSHLSIGFGCTGGQHRSVAVAEKLAEALAERGWRVSIRHSELERRGLTAPELKMG